MPITFRQNNCVIEYSEDNGSTWSFVADLSQCFSTSIIGEPGEVLRCSIATHLTTALEDMQIAVIGGMDQGADNLTLAGLVVAALGALVTGPIGGVATLVGAVTAITGKIADLGVNDYTNSLTSSFYNFAKCQLYCLLPDDGNISSADINAWASSIRSYTVASSAVRNTVADYIIDFPIETWRSLAAVAAAAQVEGSCIECDCLPECQLIADSSNGTPAPIQDPNDSSLWTLSSTSTPNEDGLYVVRYHLPYPKSCCRFEIPSGFNVSYPSSAPFAGFRNCGVPEDYDQEFTYQATPNLIDLYSVCNDTKPCFNAFYLRMNLPFTVQIRLGDCEDDGLWCYTFDFTVTNGGFSPCSFFVPTSYCSAWHSGQGWKNASGIGGVEAGGFHREFTRTRITFMSLTWVGTGGNSVGYDGGFVDLGEGTTLVGRASSAQTQANQTLTWVRDVYADIVSYCGNVSISGGSPGDFRITQITLSGFGENPFGEDNC